VYRCEETKTESSNLYLSLAASRRPNMHETNKKRHYVREHSAIREPVERRRELDRCTLYEASKRRRNSEAEEVRGEMKNKRNCFYTTSTHVQIQCSASTRIRTFQRLALAHKPKNILEDAQHHSSLYLLR